MLPAILLESGGDLLSRAVTSQVPSALKGLTSVFGKRTGGTPSPLPPEKDRARALRHTLTTAQRDEILSLAFLLTLLRLRGAFGSWSQVMKSSPRFISISTLHMLPCFHG